MKTQKVEVRNHSFNVHYRPGTPMFAFHHGMGSSLHTFELLIDSLAALLPEAGFLAYDARFHGNSHPLDTDEQPNFDIDDIVCDFEAIVAHFEPRDVFVVGHSMGGNVVSKAKVKHIAGLVVLEAVEGYAVQALTSMSSLVRSWPSSFETSQQAVDWSLGTLLRNRKSAEISIPPTLKKSASSFTFRVDLLRSEPWWDGWFKGLDAAFLGAAVPRMLILAGTGRLDKELMVGQMQGRYQLVVLSECGHFVHEDSPEKVAHTIHNFWERNSIRIVPKFGSFNSS